MFESKFPFKGNKVLSYRVLKIVLLTCIDNRLINQAKVQNKIAIKSETRMTASVLVFEPLMCLDLATYSVIPFRG